MKWRWRDLRLLGLRRRLAALQHEQSIEHRHVVDDVKDARRRITHELADTVMQLEAVTDQLEQAVDEEDEP